MCPDRSPSRRQQGGFSLLEMVVAVAILGMALGALYQAASGATRNVRADERYAYAVELGRSLLALHSRVPEAGVSDRGETAGGFSWEVRARPIPRPRDSVVPTGLLQEIEVRIAWSDGLRERSIEFASVVEGEEVQP